MIDVAESCYWTREHKLLEGLQENLKLSHKLQTRKNEQPQKQIIQMKLDEISFLSRIQDVAEKFTSIPKFRFWNMYFAFSFIILLIKKHFQGKTLTNMQNIFPTKESQSREVRVVCVVGKCWTYQEYRYW